MIQRSHFQTLKNRISGRRKFIQIIVGPRQVGKSTLVSQFLSQYAGEFLSLSADEIYGDGKLWINQHWENARLKLKLKSHKEFLLILDEIQKIPNWQDVIKSNWDADTRNSIPIKLLLLGSSRLLIQQGLSDSLAGRFEIMYMGHWTFPEMHLAFQFTPKQYVWFGAYPGAASFIDDETRWKNYILNSLIAPSIEQDILSLARIDKPSLLKNVFELACLYSGQILSYNKILGQLDNAGNTTTLAHYLQLLDLAGLVGGLKKYSPNQIRQKSSSPKMQVHNTALISALQQIDFKNAEINGDLWGRMVESTIGSILLNHSRQHGSQLYYWREGNDEVDFVFQFKGVTIGFEVKTGNHYHKKGLSSFIQKFHPDKTYSIAKSGIPWEEFLEMDPEEFIK